MVVMVVMVDTSPFHFYWQIKSSKINIINIIMRWKDDTIYNLGMFNSQYSLKITLCQTSKQSNHTHAYNLFRRQTALYEMKI